MNDVNMAEGNSKEEQVHVASVMNTLTPILLYYLSYSEIRALEVKVLIDEGKLRKVLDACILIYCPLFCKSSLSD